MANIRRGPIPSDLGWLNDLLDDYSERLRKLEAPSGEQLANLVHKSLLPVAVRRIQNDAAITPTTGSHGVVTVEVPVGYTRAVVNATAAVNLRNNDPSGWSLLMVGCMIAGMSTSPNWSTVTAQEYGLGIASDSRVLEGLTPGSAFDISAQVSFPGTYTLPIVRVTGSVLFLP